MAYTMNRKLSINVLVARYGGAHYANYNALREIVKQQKLPWDLKITDVGDIVNRLTDEQKFLNFYKLLGTSGDEFYNQILKNDWTWIHPWLLRLNRILLKINYKAGVNFFTEYWRKQQPDLVISTLPLYNKGMWESLQQAKPGTPLVVIPADLADTPPKFYIEPETGNYIVCASDKAVEQARALGVDEDRIVPTSGLIVHPRFYEPVKCDRVFEKERLGLDPDCLTGLVLFGGYGSKSMLEIAKRLESLHQKLQLIFICGHNEEIAIKLNQLQGKQKKFVTTFTQDIRYYMHLSDFLIGKAGGSSVSEAMLMKLPIIVESNNNTLLNERHNIDWIQQKQVGLAIHSLRDIGNAVEQFIKPEILARYQANIAAINNFAVFEISDFLQNLLATTSFANTSLAGKEK